MWGYKDDKIEGSVQNFELRSLLEYVNLKQGLNHKYVKKFVDQV